MSYSSPGAGFRTWHVVVFLVVVVVAVDIMSIQLMSPQNNSFSYVSAPATQPRSPVLVDVLVAAKDLPVGTKFTREELEKAVKVRKVPKDNLLPGYVGSADELVNKRLTRSVRADEIINPN